MKHKTITLAELGMSSKEMDLFAKGARHVFGEPTKKHAGFPHKKHSPSLLEPPTDQAGLGGVEEINENIP